MAGPFEFSEVQANHILDMQLSRLTRLGRSDLEEEAANLKERISELQAILGDDQKLRGVIIDELGEIREKFGEPRRSALEIDPGEFDIEDLIDDDPLVVTMSAAGYVKTVMAEEFKTQGRGGRGVRGHQTQRRGHPHPPHLDHSTLVSAFLLHTGTRIPLARP